MNKLIFLLIFVLPAPLLSQTDAGTFDRYFQKIHEDWDIPGFSVGIIKDGEVILSKGYGVLEQGKHDPANGATIYAIASNTKAFIATSLAILVHQKKIKWDDPVVDYLPYFRLYDDYVTRHATIRDLLSHRLGLGTYSGDVIWYKSNYSAEETVKRAAYVPQAYDFRAGYGYSNLMFIAAGEVIKAVSGKSWDAFVKEKIFEPLNMKRSFTSVSSLEKLDNVATPHKYRDALNEPIAWTNWDNMGAAGGILSCTDDMLKWIQLHLAGGRQIYPEEAQEVLWQPHNSYRISQASKKLFPSRHFSGYALGWSTFDYGGRQVLNHGGGYDGMYSRVAFVPELELGFVMLTNSMKGISTWMMYHVLDAYLGIEGNDWNAYGLKRQKASAESWRKRIQERIDRRMEDTQPDLPLEAFTGLYRDEMYGDIRVRLDGDQLRLEFDRAPDLGASLSHWQLNTFRIDWDQPHAWFDFGTLQFVLDNQAAARKLEFDVPNDDIFFDEIQAVKVK